VLFRVRAVEIRFGNALTIPYGRLWWRVSLKVDRKRWVVSQFVWRLLYSRVNRHVLLIAHFSAHDVTGASFRMRLIRQVKL